MCTGKASACNVSRPDPVLPTVLAGPLLRRCSPTRFVCWLALSRPCRLALRLRGPDGGEQVYRLVPGEGPCQGLRAGRHLYFVLIDLPLESALPEDEWIAYALHWQALDQPDAPWCSLLDEHPHLLYPGQSSLGFVLPVRVRSLLHGSCRKPHHPGGDGLVEADRLLGRLLAPETAPDPPGPWPSVLVMSGDQIYADDVAGPMLHAIHQVIHLLGLPDEVLPTDTLSGVAHASELYRHPLGFYRREDLLPRHQGHLKLIDVLFGGAEKPIFTTDHAHNHLITLGEVLAMYLLVWSPVLWPWVADEAPLGLDPAKQSVFAAERQTIAQFAEGLPKVQRVLAHLPSAMIFDDHDITDDWNLSREWEEVAYGHPFSKRVIGNALIAYLLCQAWGNRPQAFESMMAVAQGVLDAPGQPSHDDWIDALLRFRDWDYRWPCHPPLVVLDTRTHRWRSELSARQPSGLMDWEALTDFQHGLKGLSSVLVVSPAPVFGVKLIEVIQRLFTWWGHPLMVDAENWMAHPGSGAAILQVFRHPKTPRHFVVLSGDVHYSFVYDVELRGAVRGPDIWQICSSGLRNQFPPRLLDALDVLNRWLYAPRSPLNLLTRRRSMRVIPRKPEGTEHGRRLLNGSGIGWVELDEQGVPVRIAQCLCGGPMVAFTRREAESRWD
jgi:hypothetical protein